MGLGMGGSMTGNHDKKRAKLPFNTTTFVSGSSDYIVVSNDASLQVTDAGGAKDFSVSFWIKLTVDASSTSNKDGYIGLKAGQFRSGGFYMQYDDASGDDESIALFTSTASAQASVSSNTDLDHNVWYHIAATYDVSTTTGKIYVDGVLSATNSSLVNPTQYTGDIHIGSSNTSSKFVSSVTSDIAFWKGVVLPAETISLLSSRSISPPEAGDLSTSGNLLKGWWRLDRLSATGSNNVLDESGNDNHGTSSGLADSDFQTNDSSTGV